MINAHYAKMINLPAATYKAASLRSFCNTPEKHLRCLRSLGEAIIKGKYISDAVKTPTGVLVDLEKMKPEHEEWTVKNFRKLLKRHIDALEAGDIQ